MIVVLKKIWAFIKRFWYMPLIGGLFIVALIIFNPRLSATAKSMFYKATQSYKDEIEVLERTSAAEREEKKKNLEKYEEVLETIEKDHRNSEIELNKKEKAVVAKIVEEHRDSPEELAKAIAERIGATYVKNSNNNN